ncbi:hypothetical protein BDP27DRAFT_1344891 [Rhodocollybia butyracea]|uniref:Uncharacterized protein n=1 Tax=Rhodocollybia butyracea TaxID=206335 RepID=A0A9P5P9K9_9AGAR|nr:hypothetical protein BDP27DRAFT_1344891 [Rhodocollybia butyracea]
MILTHSPNNSDVHSVVKPTSNLSCLFTDTAAMGPVTVSAYTIGQGSPTYAPVVVGHVAKTDEFFENEIPNHCTKHVFAIRKHNIGEFFDKQLTSIKDIFREAYGNQNDAMSDAEPCITANPNGVPDKLWLTFTERSSMYHDGMKMEATAVNKGDYLVAAVRLQVVEYVLKGAKAVCYYAEIATADVYTEQGDSDTTLEDDDEVM